MSAPVPELPPSIETIDATCKHMAIQLDLTTKAVERIEERIEDKLSKIDARERSLNQIAQRFAGMSLQLQAARVLQSVSPTPVRLLMIGMGSFAGGMVWQLLVALLGQHSNFPVSLLFLER